MNARKLNSRWGLVGWVVFGAALLGCSSTLHYAPKGTAKAPEADAKITADVDSGTSITKLSVHAEHLAPPDRLIQGGTTFVAWACKSGNANCTRIGALKYSPDSRKGDLDEVTVPLTKFDLVISVESMPDPQAPSSTVVISQTVG
jgi:hypothetical protein